jgi:hypothetical protein
LSAWRFSASSLHARGPREALAFWLKAIFKPDVSFTDTMIAAAAVVVAP